MVSTRDTASGAGAARIGLSTRARLAVVAVASLVLVVAVGRWALALYAAAHSIAGRYDFSTYFAAAWALRQHPHANIYDAAVLARAGAATHVLVNPPLPYTYPPLFAIALSPFTILSFRTLSRLWLFANAGLWLAVALVLAVEIRALLGERLAASSAGAAAGAGAGAMGWARWWQRLRDDPAPLIALAVSAWLCLSFAPASQTLATGQINFLVLVPLALIPWLTRHRHERWVGVMVAVAAMLKFTPALLIAYLLLRRRWEAALAAAVALAVLALGSLAVVGPGVFFAAFPQALHVGGGDAGLGHNQALFAPLLTALRVAGSPLLGAATTASRVALVVLAAALAHVLFHLPRHTRDGAGDATGEAAAYAVALCAMVLLSPTVWVHHYVWLLPAVALALGLGGGRLLESGMRTGAPGLLCAVLVACWGLGATLPFAWDTDPQPAVTHALGLPLWPLALEMRPLAGLLLVLALWVGFRPRVSRPAPAAAASISPIELEGREHA